MGSRWRERAECASGGTNLDLWFDSVEDPYTGARRIDEPSLALCRRLCGRCPVRIECFADAMRIEGNAVEERRHGVRAGTTPEQRASLYRRFAVACPDCGETFDPAGSVNGRLVCECGEQAMWSVDDRGDQWLDRHSTLAVRVGEWLLGRAAPGERVPSPTALARELQVRKDDVIRVYRAAVRDGVLVEGGGRGVYLRAAGNRAVRGWRPAPSLRRSRTA
jgi:transcription factor WhiB